MALALRLIFLWALAPVVGATSAATSHNGGAPGVLMRTEEERCWGNCHCGPESTCGIRCSRRCAECLGKKKVSASVFSKQAINYGLRLLTEKCPGNTCNPPKTRRDPEISEYFEGECAHVVYNIQACFAELQASADGVANPKTIATAPTRPTPTTGDKAPQGALVKEDDEDDVSQGELLEGDDQDDVSQGELLEGDHQDDVSQGELLEGDHQDDISQEELLEADDDEDAQQLPAACGHKKCAACLVNHDHGPDEIKNWGDLPNSQALYLKLCPKDCKLFVDTIQTLLNNVRRKI